MSARVYEFRTTRNQLPVSSSQPTNEEPNLIDLADVNGVLETGDMAWTCSCGHPLFLISRANGIVCQACGQIQVWGPDQ